MSEILQSPIGVAVAGTGFGQKVHIPAFQSHPNTHIVAIYNRNLAKSQAIAAKYGIPHACDGIEQLVALPEVIGVSISTPPFLHYPMAETVLQAGKHLLLEKPTAMNVKEAQALHHLATTRGLATTLNFEFRYVPAWMRLKELLLESYVGHIRLIQINWLVSGRADSSHPWSWNNSKAAGGGALGALASHTFDYIAWLFGPIQRLCATLKATIPSRPDPEVGLPKPVDADDTCLLLLELKDGTPCTANISFSTYQGRGHWLEIYGDRGTLVLGNESEKDYIHGFQLWGSHAGRSLEILPIPPRLEFEQTFADGRIAPTVRVIDRWVESIRSQKSLEPSLREGVYSQLLMDLAQQSEASKTWVDVPSFNL